MVRTSFERRIRESSTRAAARTTTVKRSGRRQALAALWMRASGLCTKLRYNRDPNTGSVRYIAIELYLGIFHPFDRLAW
ncbi:MAG: hypothetical protein MI923_14250 [Phycisphaerales bacterium]|nr:hypothetical protein [Phycisphaerales bacterium]